MEPPSPGAPYHVERWDAMVTDTEGNVFGLWQAAG